MVSPNTRTKRKSGHPFTDDNVRIGADGRRICLTCKPVTKDICAVEDCEKTVHSTGYCQRHYRLFKKYGKPENLPKDQYQKPGPKIDPSKPRSKAHGGRKTHCTRGHEYTDENTDYNAAGHQVCRTCRSEDEVTECPQGHPYDEENTYISPQGYRHCRTCSRERAAAGRSGGPGRGVNNSAKTHCPRGHEYTEENTYNWKKSSGGMVRVCKACTSVKNRRILLKKYSLTEERYAEMLEACNNQCPGCGRSFDDLARKADIDHFHDCCESGSCGKCVRGLLCHDCNLLIGHSKDSPMTLINLAQYLMDAEKFRLTLH